MKLLVYCILARRDAGFDPPDEVAGRPVRLAGDDSLAAVVSDVAATPRPEVEEILAFEAVVEWFHTHFSAVIPVRFGSVFEDEAALCDVLRRGRELYHRLLLELNDAVEVGIRVLGEPAARPRRGWASPASLKRCETGGLGDLGDWARRGDSGRLRPCAKWPISSGEPAACPATGETLASGRGATWLEARREHYHSVDSRAASWDAIAIQLKAEFEGMFRLSRHDAAGGMLSIYFLVPLPQAAGFLERASQLTLSGAKVLVSGPWPPYNFAAGEIA